MLLPLNIASVQALTDKIKTNIGGYVTQANQRYTAANGYKDYPVAPPVDVLSFIPPISYIQDTPLIAVGDAVVDFDDDIGVSATGVSTLIVCLWYQEYDHEALTWKLRYMTSALASCILEDRNLGPNGGWGMTLDSIQAGPTLGRRENPRTVMGCRSLSITVRDEQDGNFQ